MARSDVCGIRGAIVVIIKILLIKYSIPFLEGKNNHGNYLLTMYIYSAILYI